MSAEFPSLTNSSKPEVPFVLTPAIKEEMMNDFNKHELSRQRRAHIALNSLSFVTSTTTLEKWIDERMGVVPFELCPKKLREEIDAKL
ncbi:hypothetical protein PoB_000654600 [Plakobranchus ocellatus]|uniref:Uncharacterized protein n=1 Tax=Plakobranchus ocellatus TaxID=259542 RepID=A0AAV3Y9Z7_9GAST|nr:hypothetical protein PoB_000654600 [Plakobranchus ocellatus]